MKHMSRTVVHPYGYFVACISIYIFFDFIAGICAATRACEYGEDMAGAGADSIAEQTTNHTASDRTNTRGRTFDLVRCHRFNDTAVGTYLRLREHGAFRMCLR